MTEVTVLVSCAAALGTWQVRLRPAGPAGQLTVRLPFGITVWLDRAEADLVLEVAGTDRQAHPEALALINVLFGPPAAELVNAERSGAAPYRPGVGEHARRLRGLLGALGTVAERSSFTVIDIARAARELAGSIRAVEPALGRLLEWTATTCALRGVSALRVLPGRDELDLSVEQHLLLDEAIAEVRELVGTDLSLGPIAAERSESAEPMLEEDWQAALDPEPLAFDDLRARSRRATSDIETGDYPPLDVSDCPLPVVVRWLTVTEQSPGDFRLDGPVTLFGCTANDEPEVLTEPEPMAAAPQIWARAIRRGDGVVLYASQCVLAGGRLTASLQVRSEFRYLEQFWIDLATAVDAPARTPAERRAFVAEQRGALAARRQRAVDRTEDWAAVGDLWSNCAALWGRTGDEERQALAAVHAARAYTAAMDQEGATRAAATARALAGQLEERWLAPELAERAEADPLDLRRLIRLADLGRPVTAWVVGELELAVAGTVPPLTDRYLAVLLDLAPRAADPGHARLRRLRARARVAVAFAAAESVQTLPLASALLAPSSADWPFLDRLGRERFAAVNRQLSITEPDGSL